MKLLISRDIWRQHFDIWLDSVASGEQRGLIALAVYTNMAVYLVLAMAAPSDTAQAIYGLGACLLLTLSLLNSLELGSPRLLAWLSWLTMQSVITAATLLDGIWTINGLFYLTTPLPILLILGTSSAAAVIGLTGLTWGALVMLELNRQLPSPIHLLSDTYWPLLLFVGLTASLLIMPLTAYFIKRKLLEQLEERNARLVAAQANLREQRIQQQQFVASVSHELRTPMNAILGFLQAVHPQSSEQSGDRDMLNHMSDSAKQLLHIINDLLDFSQLNAGRLRLHPREFDLQALVLHVVGHYRTQVRDKGVSMTVNIDDMHKWYWGDPDRLSQILHKLMQNAAKFTDTGEIHVQLRMLVKSEVCLSVRDTGRGIDPLEQPRVFHRLSRVTSRTRRDMGGTGLGLPIAQALANLMGGNISLKSEVGKGSTFAVRLPLPPAKPPAASALAANDERQQPLRKDTLEGTIIIVDDNSVNRLVARHLLLSDMPKLEILEADGAQAAFTLLEQHAADLILMDVIMPDIDGLEATQIVLRQATTQTPWVIGMSADNSDDAVERCINVGMRSVLGKPFDRQQLALTVAQALRQKQGL